MHIFNKYSFFYTNLIFIFFIALNSTLAETKAKRVYYSNVDEYSGFIPKELHRIVGESDFEFFTIDFFPKELSSGSEFYKKNEVAVVEDLPNFNDLEEGKVFNFFNSLKDKRSFSDSNLNLLLYKILSKETDFSFTREIVDIRVVSKDLPFQKIKSEIISYSPSVANPKDLTVQVYRKRLKILEPELLKNYKTLHYNFITNDEDALWLYSPILKNKRALTATNIYDDFLNTTLKLNNLYDFYIKPAKTEITSLKEKELLTAFLNPIVVANSSVKGCNLVSNDVNNIWNIDTKNFPGASEYLLSNVFFLKRKVVELELSIKDVFSKVSRQVVYVDMEFGNIVMSLDYSRDDSLLYLKIPVFAFTKLKNKYHPVLLHSLGFDLANKANHLMDKSEVKFCLNFDNVLEEIREKDF